MFIERLQCPVPRSITDLRPVACDSIVVAIMAGHEDAHSSLEVHHGPRISPRSDSPFPPDPVYVRPHSNLEQLSPSTPSKSFRDSEATKVERYSEAYRQETAPEVRSDICGLQPMTFWILVALGFTLCAGAIAGGVGGSVAVQSNRNAGTNSNEGSAASLKATHTTPSKTTPASSMPRASAPNPVPAGNSETHKSSFQLTGYPRASNGTDSGFVACGGEAPCQFRLESSRLYGWKSDNVQYVDCHGQLQVHADHVDRSCLSFDAGFSFDATTNYFFHGSSSSWWVCADKSGWYTESQGDEECEEKTLWVNPTN